jgi:hypothetical protein
MNTVLYCKVCEATFNEDDIDSTIEDINDTVKHMTPHHKTNCYYCDNPLYSTNTDANEFISKYWETHNRDREPWYAWENLVRTMYLSENPFHDIELQQKRILQESQEREAYDKQWKDFCEEDDRKQAEQKKREEESRIVKCPSCGSSQIQLIQRKWNILFGFFTNKVDRVCLNCKCKF